MDRRPTVINVGVSTLLMLFSVLCLTVFAVLALVSANSQAKLTQKAADAVTNYYLADTRAADIFDEVKSGNLSSVEKTVSNGMTYYRYGVDVDGKQQLQVVLSDSGGILDIVTWKLIWTGAWEIDKDIEVWIPNP